MTKVYVMKKILVLHGPNLNHLGIREPGQYGVVTLAALNTCLMNQAKAHNAALWAFQSNCEGALIEAIYEHAAQNIDFIIINPAAFTHTSIALRDALLATAIPFIEVHISNIYAREPFRQRSYFSDIAQGVITGLGINGYLLALDAILDQSD